MLKIQLISPPAYGLEDKLSYPPLGILYLASNLGAPCDVSVKNMVTLEEQVDAGRDIYGISVHSCSSYGPAKALAGMIRKANPGALIVAGGAFPTSMAGFFLENTEADVVAIGEGELVFAEICRAGPLPGIAGIAYKSGGRIFYNKPRELIADLDSINFPARHLLPAGMIRHEGKTHHSDQPATTIFATRGCVFNCSFCDTALWRRRWRSRSPGNIMREIEEVKKEYGVRWFRFPDDCLNLDRRWFMDFCRQIAGQGVSWTMLSRSDTLDADMLKAMKESGCREIFFGFESGSQRMLGLMNKKITVEENRKAVEMARQAGIISCAYMMFGFPGEDEASVQETKRFLLEARPDKSRISQFIPTPGTDVWNDPGKYRVRIKRNFEDYWYFDSPNFALEYDYIGNEKMSKLRQEMMDFYKEQNYFSEWKVAK